MDNGTHHSAQRVELGDTIVVVTALGGATPDAPPREVEFEVVGLLEEPEGETHYAICYCETVDEFMVTNAFGALVDDTALAQEVLDDFLKHADES